MVPAQAGLGEEPPTAALLLPRMLAPARSACVLLSIAACLCVCLWCRDPVVPSLPTIKMLSDLPAPVFSPAPALHICMPLGLSASLGAAASGGTACVSLHLGQVWLNPHCRGGSHLPHLSWDSWAAWVPSWLGAGASAAQARRCDCSSPASRCPGGHCRPAQGFRPSHQGPVLVQWLPGAPVDR